LRRTTSKKTDKKYILFTELDDPELELFDANHFLLKIKKIIKDASEGLNAAGEVRLFVICLMDFNLIDV
jgi:hypothetical protein